MQHYLSDLWFMYTHTQLEGVMLTNVCGSEEMKQSETVQGILPKFVCSGPARQNDRPTEDVSPTCPSAQQSEQDARKGVEGECISWPVAQPVGLNTAIRAGGGPKVT